MNNVNKNNIWVIKGEVVNGSYGNNIGENARGVCLSQW